MGSGIARCMGVQGMRYGIRLIVIVVIALLVGGTSAWAGDALAGVDVVRAKDVVEGTLQLGERVYQVTAATVIRDEDGKRIGLADLDVPDVPPDGLVPMTSVRIGRYQAIHKRGLLVLVSLQLTASPE